MKARSLRPYRAGPSSLTRLLRRRHSKELGTRVGVLRLMARKQQRTGLPSRQQILDFIEGSDQPAGKREIARAFGLSGHDKIALKQILRDMGDEGLIDSAPGRAFHKMGGVPKVKIGRASCRERV